MNILQNSYNMYNFTLTVFSIVAMLSLVCDDWPTASCSAFDWSD